MTGLLLGRRSGTITIIGGDDPFIGESILLRFIAITNWQGFNGKWTLFRFLL
jgi:hypothetical protein